MPTHNITLTKVLDRFVLTSIESGPYENASEREAQEQAAKLTAVRTAIDDGEASSLAEAGVFDRVRQQLQFIKTRLSRTIAG